jgi:hypothetical protein
MRYCRKQSVSSGRTLRYLRLYEELGNGGNGCPLDNDVDKAEIMDLCEPFMIPLMDDDVFEYGIYPKVIERYPFLNLVILRKDKEDFSWGEVKDNVIPMFHMLCKKYMPDNWSVKTGQEVHFYKDSHTVYYVGDLIFDGKDGPSDSKMTRAVCLKLYQKIDYTGWGMRWQGEARR